MINIHEHPVSTAVSTTYLRPCVFTTKKKVICLSCAHAALRSLLRHPIVKQRRFRLAGPVLCRFFHQPFLGGYREATTWTAPNGKPLWISCGQHLTVGIPKMSRMVLLLGCSSTHIEIVGYAMLRHPYGCMTCRWYRSKWENGWLLTAHTTLCVRMVPMYLYVLKNAITWLISWLIMMAYPKIKRLITSQYILLILRTISNQYKQVSTLHRW